MTTESVTAWADVRGRLSRMGLSIAVASGAYGLSFGALSTAGGLSVLQTCALSVLTLVVDARVAGVAVAAVALVLRAPFIVVVAAAALTAALLRAMT